MRLLTIAFATLVAFGQIPDCGPADLDATFSFPAKSDRQLVVLQLKNISPAACLLRANAGGMVVAGRWAETDRRAPDLELAAGAEAYREASWSSVYSNPPSACEDRRDILFTVNSEPRAAYGILPPEVLGQKCSPTQLSPYQPGNFLEANDEFGRLIEHRSVTVTAEKLDLLEFESDMLHITGDNLEPLDEKKCPILFYKTRSEKGDTKFYEFPRAGGCADTSGSDRFSRDEVFTWPSQGIYTVSVAHLAEANLLVYSKPIDLNIASPSSLKRAWNPPVRGLRLALNLDRNTFELGDDIHLHTAIEDAGAELPIYQDSCISPVKFEVRDAWGRLLHPTKLYTPGHPTRLVGFCHMGSLAIPKDQAIFLESTLIEWGVLPEQPGDYTVTAVWNALQEKGLPTEPDNFRRAVETYAFVRSQPISFRVVQKKN